MSQTDDHPSAPLAPAPPKAPVAKIDASDEPALTYDGKVTEILILFLANVVLNILTLGFTAFGAKPAFGGTSGATCDWATTVSNIVARAWRYSFPL